LKSVRLAFRTILCLFLLTGCMEKAVISQQTVPAETASVSAAAEPTEISLLDYTKLPQGYELQEQESGSLLITENGETIGAIDIYLIPAGTVHDPYYRWLETLGIPDYETDGLWRSGGGSLYGNWEMHFGSDVPPGVESTVSRYHTFYVGKTKVWDVWFDLMMIDRATMDILLEALTVY